MTSAVPRIALHASHPAQIWVLKALADALEGQVEPLWFVRNKDITVRLAELLELNAEVLSDARPGLANNAIELISQTRKVLQINRRKHIDLWVSKHSAVHIARALSGKRSVAFNDDDVDVIPLLAWTAFPFTNAVIVPDSIRMGRFEAKSVRVPSHFELMYLHPSRFKPDPNIYNELGVAPGNKFALVRLSALRAHHDVGVTGVSKQLLRAVIELCQKRKIALFITSEKALEPEFDPYRLAISPLRIHHALSFAEFFLGDSQTMTSEAALLGTPAYRISDFVGQLSAITTLEKLGLAFGYRGQELERPLQDLTSYVECSEGKALFLERRDAALRARIDPLPAFVTLVQSLLKGRTAQQAREDSRDYCSETPRKMEIAANQ